jgi:hypothetical protein
MSPEELSPRSEEFRENPQSHYSIFPAPKVFTQLANLPNRTIPSQETKNPLLLKPIDYKMQLMTQEQELIALNNIHQKLSEKLETLQIELDTVKDVPILMKEKDKKIKTLEVSLELAQEEAKILGKEETSEKKQVIFAFDYFKQSKPVRVWKSDPLLLHFNLLKQELLKDLQSHLKEANV